MEYKGKKDRKQGEGGKERRMKGRRMISVRIGAVLRKEKLVNCKREGYYFPEAGEDSLRRCRLSSDLNNEKELFLQIEKNDGRCNDL